MNWKVEYLSAARRQLKQLEPETRREILSWMREQVVEGDNPRDAGKALQAKWAGHWVYRVNTYRVICKIQDERLLVMVVKAGHRSSVYE